MIALAIAAFFSGACDRAISRKPAPIGPAVPSAYDLAVGKSVYLTYCATCHGTTGAGDGFNAFNLDPRPPDLGAPEFRKKSDADLADVIRRGGAGVGVSSLMPPWGHTLNDRQIEDVVHYVRRLKGRAE